MLYGHTGHGKTTFVRHFFQQYLPERHPELSKRTVAIRLDLGVSGLTSDSFEDHVDNGIHNFLDRYFPELYEDKNLVAMAEMCTDMSTDFYKRLCGRLEMGTSRESKLQWIGAIFGRQSVTPNITNPFSDFNRIRITYLTQKCGKNFVIAFDNIDQLPRSIQGHAAFFLARHKMEWLQDSDRITIITVLRAYMVARAAKELPLAAYQTRSELLLRPPRFLDVLRRRIKYVEMALPDAVVVEDRTVFDGRSVPVSVRKQAFVHLIDKIAEALDAAGHTLGLQALANGDIRQQLLMTRMFLHSPHIEWLCLRSLLDDRPPTITFPRILDTLVRGTNAICSPSLEQFFLNIFDAEAVQAFPNTLNRLYILGIVDCGYTPVDELVSLLADLGHPEPCTKSSLEQMLTAGILVSPEGLLLEEDEVRRISVNEEDTVLGGLYLRVLPYELSYMQAMAYRTPMTPELLQKVPIPECGSDSAALFVARTKAAAILIKQVLNDETLQRRCCEKRPTALRTLERYGLEGIGLKMAQAANQQLARIESSGTFASLNCAQLQDLFQQN